MVICDRENLAEEAFAREVGGVGAFVEFLGGEAVAVCGEGVEFVGGGKPGGVDARFDFGELSVDGFGDTAVETGKRGRRWEERGQESQWGGRLAYRMLIRSRRF